MSKKTYVVHNGKSTDLHHQKLTDADAVRLRREGNYVYEKKEKRNEQ